MKIDRPLWADGVLLSAQQFQQQARWEAWSNACVADLALVHPWGVNAMSFDQEALRLGKVKAIRLCLRMPDGTQIDTQRTDPLPPALTLSDLVSRDCRRVTVLLALPLEHGNGNNCIFDGARSERPTRYRQVWREVQDHFGDEAVSIGVLEHQISLRLHTDDNSEYLVCPLVRLVRDDLGVWAIDPDYVPPLLGFYAHAGLMKQLRLLWVLGEADQVDLLVPGLAEKRWLHDQNTVLLWLGSSQSPAVAERLERWRALRAWRPVDGFIWVLSEGQRDTADFVATGTRFLQNVMRTLRWQAPLHLWQLSATEWEQAQRPQQTVGRVFPGAGGGAADQRGGCSAVVCQFSDGARRIYPSGLGGPGASGH